MSINCADSFSGDYREARARFREAVASAGGALEAVAHPLKGPDGGDLSTDIAWFGPRDAERVLVTISGTHGVEGFCGSGAQTHWLYRGEAARLPSGMAALMIHAINPYGFAWLRRVNEDNVDLNRNWIDFAAPLSRNPGYDELAGFPPTGVSGHAGRLLLGRLGGTPVLALCGRAHYYEGHDLDRTAAQHRPHRHFHGAGIGGWHNADQVVSRNLQNRAGLVDGLFQARLAGFGAVRATDERPLQVFHFPAGALGAGAGREFGAGRARSRLGEGRHGLSPILTDERRPVGRAWPGAVDTPIAPKRE